jgi:hypothetical protein
MAIWCITNVAFKYILRFFGILVHVLVCCAKKNLVGLVDFMQYDQIDFSHFGLHKIITLGTLISFTPVHVKNDSFLKYELCINLAFNCHKMEALCQ